MYHTSILTALYSPTTLSRILILTRKSVDFPIFILRTKQIKSPQWSLGQAEGNAGSNNVLAACTAVSVHFSCLTTQRRNCISRPRLCTGQNWISLSDLFNVSYCCQGLDVVVAVVCEPFSPPFLLPVILWLTFAFPTLSNLGCYDYLEICALATYFFWTLIL